MSKKTTKTTKTEKTAKTEKAERNLPPKELLDEMRAEHRQRIERAKAKTTKRSRQAKRVAKPTTVGSGRTTLMALWKAVAKEEQKREREQKRAERLALREAAKAAKRDRRAQEAMLREQQRADRRLCRVRKPVFSRLRLMLVMEGSDGAQSYTINQSVSEVSGTGFRCNERRAREVLLTALRNLDTNASARESLDDAARHGGLKG